jgi:hypothetical protein
MPHIALTQGESLLDQDESYEKIFRSSYPMEVYVNVLDLFQRTDGYLQDLQGADRLPGGSIEPWRFHYAYVVTGLLTRTPDPTPRVVERLSAESFTEARARRLWHLLQESYEGSVTARVGTGLHEIAGSPELSRRLRLALGETIRRGSIQ